MQQQQQGPDLSNVDLTHAKDIVCEECGNKGFRQTMMLKKLSALVSPTGKAGVVPVPYYYCMKCGMRMNLEKVQ